MMKKSTQSHPWKVLGSLFLMATVMSSTYGGVASYLKYRKSVQPGMNLDLNTLHFFIKEDIKRKIQAVTASSLPAQTKIPSIYLFTAERDLTALESDLPSSGKTQEISGHIKDSEDLLSSEAQFRYRGGLPIHWLHKKKSFRVNLPPYTTYRGAQSFNVVTPTTIETVTDWVSNKISKEIGLITPDFEPVRLYVNNEYNGLHFYLDQIDESLLRKSHRMPGSIYSGDTIYVPNPFGPDRDGVNETTFLDLDGTPLMWSDYRLWDKDAARNAETKNDHSDIKLFIDTINYNELSAFKESFDKYFDKEKFFNYWALDSMVGAYHHDNFHNHKIYFDPYLGKFEPIQWDIRFWTTFFLAKDIAMYPLLMKAKQIPEYEYRKDLATYKLMQSYPAAEIEKRIKSAATQIRPEVSADPYRHHMGPKFGIFTLNKEVPFGMDEFDEAIEYLQRTFSERQKFLLSVFDSTDARYNIEKIDSNKFKLTISVSDNSPIDIDLYSELGPGVTIDRTYKSNLTRLRKGEMSRLYPGKKIKKGNITGRDGTWSRLTFGKEMPIASPLHYSFLITTNNSIDDKIQLSARNAVTGKALTVQAAKKLPDDRQTTSLHPWETEKPHAEEITLSGNIEIESDRIYNEHQKVTILPGTKIKLGANASLIFYGQVTALGSPGAPIEFGRLNPQMHWGAVVIQGNAANGSKMDHVIVDGGSLTRQRLINYPAQINFHDLDQFSISNCEIKNNVIGDDSLHVAYSKGEIHDCHFENTAFDAIDIDISEVKVYNNSFVAVGNDALDVMTSKIDVNNIKVASAGDKCISAGEDSRVFVTKSLLEHCQIGIAAKDKSVVRITESKLSSNRESAISLYRKNARYSQGGTLEGEGLTGFDDNEVISDPYSKYSINVKHTQTR